MRKASDIISALFRDRFGPEFAENARYSAGLFSSWTQVVAEVWSWPNLSRTDPDFEDIPAAAIHSRIRELERGVLLVEADHPGWVQILQTKQRELLLAVQRRHPKLGIQAIAFMLSRGSPPEPAAEVQTKTSITVQQVQDEPEKLEKHENHKKPKDKEFYTALKGIEESIKKRNDL